MEEFSDDDSFKSACSAASIEEPSSPHTHQHAQFPSNSPREHHRDDANSVSGGDDHDESSSLAESVASLSASTLFRSAHSTLDQCGNGSVMSGKSSAATPATNDHAGPNAAKSNKCDEDGEQCNSQIQNSPPQRLPSKQRSQSKAHNNKDSWRLITSRTETSRPTVTSTSFNQDASCVCIGTEKGFRIRTIMPPVGGNTNMVHQCQIPAGVALCHMLYGTSLLAMVNTPRPRTLSLVNAWTGEVLRDLHFVASIQRVEMNHKILCVLAADGQVHVFNTATLQLIKSIGVIHPSDPARGIEGPNASTAGAFFAISNVEDELFVACRCKKRLGWVRVYKITEQMGIRLAPIGAFDAHNHSISRIAIGGPKGKQKLATASEKGTVIRIFGLGSKFGKLDVLLRGSSPCAMHCIAFNFNASLVAASSSTGTIHTFRLEDGPNTSASTDTAKEKAAHKLKLSRLIPQVVSDQRDGKRSFAKIRLKSIIASQPLSLAFLPSNQLVVLTNEGIIQRFVVDNSQDKPIQVASEDSLLEDSNLTYNRA